MAKYLVRRIATQVIEYTATTPDALYIEGPIELTPYTPPGCELIAYDGPVSLTAPSPTAVLRWDGTAPAWVEEGDLSTLRQRKAADMSQACGDAILAGFTSSALGASYAYPAKAEDQANLTGSVVRSFYPTVTADWRTPFWCCDTKGEWDYRQHTAVQIQQVGDDAVAARLKCMAINQQLADRIVTASAEQLATIEWPT
jgi:hypothetical protein